MGNLCLSEQAVYTQNSCTSTQANQRPLLFSCFTIVQSLLFLSKLKSFELVSLAE